ncbi:MAG: translocation/assembly module TamB domain-containing protein, partial [Culturomica sp.]|nr:translocation/assembly module TamB domain-containing protein [Culturomica sp.]
MTAAAFLLLLFVLHISLHNPRVQTLLVRHFTQRIERLTGVKMEIGGVDFRPVKSLILNDLLLRDHRNDTLLFCKKMFVEVDSFRWSGRRFTVREVTLEEAYFNLWISRGEEESVMNIELFLDSLARLNNEPPEKAGRQRKWMVGLDKIRLRNCRFVYQEEQYEPVDYGINWTDVECRDVNVDLTDFKFSGDTTMIRFSGLSLTEKSGFSIRELNTGATLRDSMILLTDTEIYTERSRLFLEQLIFRWNPGQREWRYFTQKVHQYYKLGPSSISFIDLAYFNGVLVGIDNTITCRGVVSNTVNRIEGKDLLIGIGEHSTFRGSFTSRGLPDIYNTVFDIDFYDAYLDPADLETIYLPWFAWKIRIPDPLHKWNGFRLDGKFTGTIEEFLLRVNSRTPGLTGGFRLAYEPAGIDSVDYSRLSGDFHFSRVAVGRMSGSGSIGNAQLAGAYSGVLGEKDALNVTAKLHRMRVSDGVLTGADLYMTWEEGRINGMATVDSDSLGGTLVLDYDPSPEQLFLSVKGAVDVKNLRSFGWGINGGEESFRTEFNWVHGEKGTDNSLTHIALSGTNYTGEKGAFTVPYISIESRSDSGYRTTSFVSDLADLYLEGSVLPRQPVDFIANAVKRYLPVYGSAGTAVSNREQEPVDFSCFLHLKEVNPVLSVLSPKIRIADGSTLSADYRNNGEEFTALIESDSVTCGDYRFRDMQLRMDGGEERMDLLCMLDQLEYRNEYRLYNVRGELALQDNTVRNRLVWCNWGAETYSGELAADLRFRPSKKDDFATEIAIHRGVILLADSVWQVDPSRMVVEGKEIRIDRFRLWNNDQQLAINGAISENPEEKLSLELSRFDLSELNRLLFKERLNVFGVATGQVQIRDYYKDNHIYSDISVRNWGLERDTLGSMHLLSSWDTDSSRLVLQAENQTEQSVPLDIKGHYKPSTDSLDLEIRLSEVGLERLQVYASDYFSMSRGNLSGHVHLSGRIRNPELNGYLSLNGVDLKIRNLNTSFRVNDTLHIRNNRLDAIDLEIRDAEGRPARCTGYYDLYADRYDLQANLRNFLLMNTRPEHNETFYGKVYASGFVHLRNPSGNDDITVNLRTERDSRLYLPLESGETGSGNNFLRFIREGEVERQKNPVTYGRYGMTLDANLEIDENLEIQVVFDPTIGDVLKTNGNGNLKIGLDQDGMLNMFGEYKISKGDYLFTLSNLLNKKFVLTPGG